MIIIFGRIYSEVSKKLVLAENHRYDSDFENSTANKTYMFAFVNTYISNFVVICYNQKFGALTTNLLVVMVFKQVIINSIEFLKERCKIQSRIDDSNELFVIPVAEAERNEDEL